MTTLIAAIGKNNELGKNNDLIWHLPADLKRFKKVTSGPHIIMGRKTYESIGKPLPNRTSIIITKDTSYNAQGCLVTNSLQNAIKLAKEDSNAYVIGGAQIYNQAINLVDVLDICEVHETFEADVFFPKIDPKKWEEVERTSFEANDKHAHAYSFVKYKRIA